MTSKVSYVDLAILDEDEPVGEVSEGLLKDMRLLFIELLRAAYNAQILLGELDPREYDGFLAYSLKQSIEFAHDDASKGKPLDDWELSRIVSTKYVDNTRDIFVRLYGALFVMEKGDKAHSHPVGGAEQLESQQLRLTVLRAFSFVDAHKEAEGRFRDKFEDSTGDVHAAFLTVMRESKKQVTLAESVIKSKTKKQLKRVISHYLCVTLLNKSARYVRRCDSSVGLQTEIRATRLSLFVPCLVFLRSPCWWNLEYCWPRKAENCLKRWTTHCRKSALVRSASTLAQCSLRRTKKI